MNRRRFFASIAGFFGAKKTGLAKCFKSRFTSRRAVLDRMTLATEAALGREMKKSYSVLVNDLIFKASPLRKMAYRMKSKSNEPFDGGTYISQPLIYDTKPEEKE